MTTIVSELYEALKAAGVEDDIARAAAKSVIAAEDKEQLATKADLMELKLATKADLLVLKMDLQAAMAALKDDLHRTLITTMVGMTAIFSLIVTIAVRFLR